MSRKTERLVNLTIALLATKRYLTKSEIFRTVDGYEGSPETKERMFERDKDDLRNLGIVIEVGSFDPLFDDEAGYRIFRSTYSFQFGELSAREIALLSLAAQAWRGQALDSSAHSVLIKLKSIGIESDFSSLPALAPHITADPENIGRITKAISTRTPISFSYYSSSLELESRAVEPYGAGSSKGHWYVIGRDLSKDALRVFRLDRISGEIASLGKPSSYVIPSDFSAAPYLSPLSESKNATILIRSGHVHEMRMRGVEVSNDVVSGWDSYAVTYAYEEQFLEEILWHGDNVIVISPPELRNQVIKSLNEIVEVHG